MPDRVGRGVARPRHTERDARDPLPGAALGRDLRASKRSYGARHHQRGSERDAGGARGGEPLQEDRQDVSTRHRRRHQGLSDRQRLLRRVSLACRVGAPPRLARASAQQGAQQHQLVREARQDARPGARRRDRQGDARGSERGGQEQAALASAQDRARQEARQGYLSQEHESQVFATLQCRSRPQHEQ